ncbi:hypothetical protein AB0N09_39825 [Streptomyces erythrochromogenes]|uniref:hypothetical protein n=1 Tax=Streptomyces erythrochromogenes TaxID=285574 RepID=UPI0034120DCA
MEDGFAGAPMSSALPPETLDEIARLVSCKDFLALSATSTELRGRYWGVGSQAELDAALLAQDTHVIVLTVPGLTVSTAPVSGAHVYAMADAHVAAGTVHVRDDGVHLIATGYAEVHAAGHAHVTAHDYARVHAHTEAHVTAHDCARVSAYARTQVDAYGGALVTAREHAQVAAHDQAQVTAADWSRVRAYGRAHVAMESRDCWIAASEGTAVYGTDGHLLYTSTVSLALYNPNRSFLTAPHRIDAEWSELEGLWNAQHSGSCEIL